ncbi:MAG: DUF3089 domain-containing protein [Bacteroidia bacterium]|nr:DUF3089 domain-containing protein [Bacteroidia bacterium]
MSHRTATAAAALLFAAWTAVSCDNRQPPAAAFGAYPVPQAPDYSQAAAWAALPDRQDPADLAPPGAAPEGQDSARADVFFIHPTTCMGGAAWNAPLDSTALNEDTDFWPIRHQASAFNRAGRVFAPRYRQMFFGGFFGTDSASEAQALALAYGDVKAAFEYYLRHHNQGRPIVIAGHSQGALHGIRLVKEYFDGTPLQEQLVAAYLLGWPFPASTFQHLPVCDAADATGCVIGWCSWREGYEPPGIDTYYKDAVVVNPLTWKTDGQPGSESLHRGFVWKDFDKIRPNLVGAQAHQGILWVSRPIPLVPGKNYHTGDINLFWQDVRDNAELRIRTFLSGR